MFKHLQVEMRTFSDFDMLYKYVNILPDFPALSSNQHIFLKKLPEVDVRQVSPSAGNSIFLKKLPGFPALPALIFHTAVIISNIFNSTLCSNTRFSEKKKKNGV